MKRTAWVYQKPAQVRELGANRASWYVGWYDLDRRRKSESCGPGFVGQKTAEARRHELEKKFRAGTDEIRTDVTWEQFRSEYVDKILSGKRVRSSDEALTSLTHFERIVKPHRVCTIRTTDIDNFIAARRSEAGKKRGDVVSPATINKDLRHIKAALAKAKRWNYIAQLPEFTMQKVTKKLVVYVVAEHFAAIYQACSHAKRPRDQAYAAADWWRGLLVMGYMTGWRIGDMLALGREDVDLDAGTAITRGEDNKGGRDELIRLHPVVVQHLRKLAGFDPRIFPWNHHRRTLDVEFLRIQEKAGIHLPCRKSHTHTPACHVYGFHDLRRAFATMNADRLTPDALQALMRHKSYLTTQVYINMAPQIDEAVAGLHVPEVLREEAE
jgi:integrase